MNKTYFIYQQIQREKLVDLLPMINPVVCFVEKLLEEGYSKSFNVGSRNEGIYLNDKFCYKLLSQNRRKILSEDFEFSRIFPHVVTMHSIDIDRHNYIGIKLDCVHFNMPDYFEALYVMYGYEEYKEFVDRVRKIIKFQMLVTDKELENLGFYHDDRKLENFGICVYDEQPKEFKTEGDKLKYEIGNYTFLLNNSVPSLIERGSHQYLIFKFIDIDEMVSRREKEAKFLTNPKTKHDHDKIKMRMKKIGCYYNFYDIYGKYKTPGNMTSLMIDSDKIADYLAEAPLPNVWSSLRLPYIFAHMKDSTHKKGNKILNVLQSLFKSKDKTKFVCVSDFNKILPIDILTRKLKSDEERFKAIANIIYNVDDGLLSFRTNSDHSISSGSEEEK